MFFVLSANKKAVSVIALHRRYRQTPDRKRKQKRPYQTYGHCILAAGSGHKKVWRFFYGTATQRLLQVFEIQIFIAKYFLLF